MLSRRSGITNSYKRTATSEQNLYYETDRLKIRILFDINAIFNQPLTECLAIIQIFDEPTNINIAYNQSDNVSERYVINPGEIAYLQLDNPNSTFLDIEGDYKLKLKAYQLKSNQKEVKNETNS